MRTSESKIASLPGNAPTPIGASAAENLRYIRSTMEAAHTFTSVPAKGCIAMGLIAVLAAALEMSPTLAIYWLPIWLMAAVSSSAIALYFMVAKSEREGRSLRRTVAQRFFLALAPAFVCGAVLTAALNGIVGREIIAGVWLLMYGVGVAASGVFSIPVVLIAGYAFMGLGVATLVAPASWAPANLALGFGGIHLMLGMIIWRKHGG
jgi:hypothetical protein